MTECVNWKGPIDKYGYGFDIRITRLAHRLEFERKHGPISKGLCVLHRCDNRRCVNPDHLFLGTHHDNLRDRDAKGRMARGEKLPQSKLNDFQARVIRLAIRQRIKNTWLADHYGVEQGTISAVKTGRTWKHV